MTDQRHFTDEELTAYLDGEIPRATRRAIEAALDGDTVLQHRLGMLHLSVPSINRAFDTLLGIAPASPALPDQPVSTRAFSLPKALAAAVACVAVGAGLAFGAMSWRANTPDWKDYVAAYQSLYVNGTLAPVDLTAADARRNLATLGAVLNHDLNGAQTDAVLDFKRGQVLGYQGHPLIQLAYLDPLGAPVALCIMRTQMPTSLGISVIDLEGMAAAHWEKDGLAYLLIGGTDSGLIAAAAERFAARL